MASATTAPEAPLGAVVATAVLAQVAPEKPVEQLLHVGPDQPEAHVQLPVMPLVHAPFSHR